MAEKLTMKTEMSKLEMTRNAFGEDAIGVSCYDFPEDS